MSRPGDAAAGATRAGQSPDLNQIVIEYLAKKGYTRTESMLRQEAANENVEASKPAWQKDVEAGRAFEKGYSGLVSWIDGNLDLYQPELRRLLWPIFVYSYLQLLQGSFEKAAREFFKTHSGTFEPEHTDDLKKLSTIGLAEHVEQSEIGKLYLHNKYRVTLSNASYELLILHLESKDGVPQTRNTIGNHLKIVTIARAADEKFSISSMLRRTKQIENVPGEDEGIPGHNPGSAQVEQATTAAVLTRLKLGPLPLEPDLIDDVRFELSDLQAEGHLTNGTSTLTQEFDAMIKKEDADEAPVREDLPLPPSTARDVAMEVNRVRENRQRFRIETRTGGLPPAISVCMFTFHNSYDTVNCVEISDDQQFIACGTNDHYVRVWRIDGKALPSVVEGEQPSASRRLIGHSGPVYNISFSPSIASDAKADTPETDPTYLLSASSDKTVRLWHLKTWSCLVVYKGHLGPVWDVTWGPFGHYFLTGSQDKTARLWSTENIAPLRYFVGHESSVDCVTFHPNNAYCFSAGGDKTVRMWAVNNGYPVRMFTGHTSGVTAIACAPNGKILASADDAGEIIIWDLGPGRLQKRMRGHARGGIWSLSFSVESNILISGGMDGTVRVWDVAGSTAEIPNGTTTADGSAAKADGTSVPNGISGVTTGGLGPTGKKKAKDDAISADQISAFPTKKSPVYKVKFTRMNLALAAGAYLPGGKN